MIEELDELRERIASLPEEEQAPALFALEVIEDEQAERASDDERRELPRMQAS